MRANDIHSKNLKKSPKELSNPYDNVEVLIKLSSKILAKFSELESRLEVQEAILLEIRKHSSHLKQEQIRSVEPIRGIHGLANFLGVSAVTAQKLKNSGKIPFAQFERVVLFDPDKVMQSLEVNLKFAKRKKQ